MKNTQHNRIIENFPFAYGGAVTVKVQIQEYANGGERLNLLYHDMDGWYPQATCSSWIPGLSVDELAIKNYSENEGMLKALVEANVVSAPHRTQDGFPVVKLSEWNDDYNEEEASIYWDKVGNAEPPF